ncbi:MAG: plastocyanin/azurin family copper-binding protein [Actinomycetota bacterium]
MPVFKLKFLAVPAAAGLLALAACGGGTDAGPTSGGEVRTVEVRALDTLRFEPASLSVTKGEKIRFVVTNSGKIDHEFVVGDEETQMAHEDQSGEMDHMAAESLAALDLKPGETKEATVTFDEAGKVLFGCHEPGHYNGGMVGTITVG